MEGVKFFLASHLLFDCLFIVFTAAPVSAAQSDVIVQDKFGGQILGFDIDQAGDEGVLCEYTDLNNGNVMAAVETLSQTTGAILAVVDKTMKSDDFVTLGVAGDSVGLIEQEHETRMTTVRRSFHLIDPLDSNKFTGAWTPPLDRNHLVELVSRNQGEPINAVWTLDLSENFEPTVFSTNVAANTFGPVIGITDQDFTSGATPGFAYDTATNQAVLGKAKLGNPFVPGAIATVDLTTGAFVKFSAVGDGDVNGLAVDPGSGTVCTTTEIDFSVEFYDLATKTGTRQILPNAPNQFYSGADVEFDATNKVFLVAQPNSSSAQSGSTIYEYSVKGALRKTINGLNFSNASNVIAAHIAFNPTTRIGFVDGPDITAGQIQSFKY